MKSLLKFAPMGFVENLKYMGIGMLGVFIIVGIIVLATYIIGKYTGGKNKN
jgi:hypothetical protein